MKLPKIPNEEGIRELFLWAECLIQGWANLPRGYPAEIKHSLKKKIGILADLVRDQKEKDTGDIFFWGMVKLVSEAQELLEEEDLTHDLTVRADQLMRKYLKDVDNADQNPIDNRDVNRSLLANKRR